MRLAYLVMFGLFTAAQSHAEAAILVGSLNERSQSTVNVTNIQGIIDEYNQNYANASGYQELPDVIESVGKIDAGDVDFPSGDSLSRSDFTFFEESTSSPHSTSLDVFGTTVNFDAVSDTAVLPNKTPLGFTLKDSSDPIFFYYVSKAGQSWSLWAMDDADGFNPVYSDLFTDSYTNKQTIGYIWKDPSDSSADIPGTLSDQYAYEYDPRSQGGAVSNISFWSAAGGPGDDGDPVPEPRTFVIWLAMGLGAIAYGRRLYTRPKPPVNSLVKLRNIWSAGSQAMRPL